MALTFLRGTKLILEDSNNDAYVLDISDVTLNQTYLERSRDTRTLHNNNLYEDTLINEVSNCSFSFTVNVSNTDTVLLEWLGCIDVSGDYRLPVTKVSSMTGSDLMTIYIDSGNTIFRITNAVVENFSIGLETKKALTFNITGLGEARSEIAALPTFNSSTNQAAFSAGTLAVSVDATPLTNVVAATVEITRNITWLNQNTVHNGVAGSLYTKNVPVLKGSAISGQITQNKTDDSIDTTTNNTIEIVYNNSFTVSLDSCNITDRWAMQSVFKKIRDYKLLPNASTPFIRF